MYRAPPCPRRIPMSDQNAVPDRMLQLTEDVLNNRLKDGSIEELEDMLRSNPAARTFFRAYCQLHIDLLAETQAMRTIHFFASDDWIIENRLSLPAEVNNQQHMNRDRAFTK